MLRQYIVAASVLINTTLGNTTNHEQQCETYV